MYPKCIRNVIDCFKNLPGIGEKTAERLAFSLIGFSKENLTSFSAAITDIRDKITTCEICGNIADSNICNICSDKERNSNIIFVVEKAKDISLFEKINIYNGKYHVLGGLISPLDGIGPDDININKLIDRIDNESVHEIIMALKPSIEGETTMQYIKKILENKNVKVTRIATGIPMGTDIEYIDAMTLEFALEGRKDI
jgi:recombination protein RecR